MKSKFNLGDTVEDKITKYKGKITSIAFYIDREPMYLIENIDTTNRPIDFWYGESRLTHLSKVQELGEENE